LTAGTEKLCLKGAYFLGRSIFLIFIGFFNAFQSVVADGRSPEWCDAGGPYIGLADEIPVSFDGAFWEVPPNRYPTIILWTFGDGDTSDEEDPVHIYTHSNHQEPFDVLLEFWANNTYCNDTTTVRIWDEDEFELILDVHHENYTTLFPLLTDQTFVCEGGNAGYSDDTTPPFTLTIDVYKLVGIQWIYQGNLYESDEFDEIEPGGDMPSVETEWVNVGPTGWYRVWAKAWFPDSNYVIAEDWWLCRVMSI
jgi:hypothetical protein